MSDKKRAALILPVILLAAVTFLVYLPALKNGFVLWDDPEYVYENPFIKSFDLKFFKWLSGAVVVANWHPLTMLSHALDYAIWGLNPAGHHLSAIIFHSINTALVFALSMRLMRGWHGALAASLTAALLFGLHPIHVESVVWISERKDVLCALFFLLSLLAYLEYASTASKKRLLYYWAALISFLLALLSKPMAISLPAVFLIIDYYPLERFKSVKAVRDAVVEKIPFYLLSLASAMVTMWAQKKGGAIVSVEQYPFADRVAGAFYSYVFYLYKTVLPLKLYPLYPLERAGFTVAALIAVIIFAAITVYSVYSIGRRKIFSAVWLYYILTLLPVIGIVQVGKQSAADRYMYLPGIAVFILAGTGAALLYGRLGKRSKYIAAAAFVAVLVFFSALTVRQEGVWKDSITLWTYEIGAYPDKVPVAYYNRGVAYGKAGRYDEALREYTRAIELDPKSMEAYLNRGLIYDRFAMYGLAIEDYGRALVIDPGHANTYINLGTARIRSGDLEGGIKDLERAAALNQADPLPYYDLGLIYFKAGDREKALYYMRKASALGMREAADYLGRL